MTALIEGPRWTSPGSGRYAGRYPLAVERFTLGQVDRLLPGVTTVTPHGRYYALHSAVAAEAERRDLSDVEAQELLRRVEVTCAAVSVQHERSDSHHGLGRAHGADALSHSTDDDGVDVSQAAGNGPSRYAKAPWGFWGPYRGAEIMIGALAPDRLRPGPNYSADRVSTAFADIFDLASQSHLPTAVLREAQHLCICAGATSTDGQWLAELLATPEIDDVRSRAATRRQTIRLFLRALELAPGRTLTRDPSAAIAYGPFADTDPVLSQLDVTPAWRGTILRVESVTAWRNLWSWLVSQINGLTPRQSLGDTFAAAMPATTVRQFRDALPPLRDADGYIAPAERDGALRDLDRPAQALAVLLLGGLRTRDLNGETLIGFHGKSATESEQQLAPLWIDALANDWQDRPLRDLARHLTEVMLDRAQRISLRKATRSRSTGHLRVPTRVYLRDNLVFKDSNEGNSPVGLRWDQLGTVLAEAGVIALVGNQWTITDRGRHVIG